MYRVANQSFLCSGTGSKACMTQLQDTLTVELFGVLLPRLFAKYACA